MQKEQSQQPRTLLYILNSIDFFFSHRLPVALEAQKRGWQIKVVAAGASEDKRFAEYGFEGIDLPAVEGKLNPFR